MPVFKNVFIHHVFFWLNDPSSKKDLGLLVTGLKRLTSIQTIRDSHIGVPAGTNRDVIERSYSVSWFVRFDNAADQESYQVDPIHLQFVKDCSGLWSKVVVHDSVDA